MNPNKIVNPSDQTQALLPLFVGENYQTFVNFMAKASESEERVGFGQDLLQNLLKYRDVNTYSKGVVVSNSLAVAIDEVEEDTITLTDGRGFPLYNGVILIDDEPQKHSHTCYKDNVISIRPWRNDNQRDHVLKDCLAIVKQMRHSKNVSKDLPQFVELYNSLIEE